MLLGAFFLLLFLSSFTSPALAAPNCGPDDPFCLDTAAVGGGMMTKGATAPSPAVAIGRIVKIGLELIGVIFFVLVLYAGFRWMIARGNSEEIEAAKKTIENAAIGLIAVILSYALTTYIVSNLFNSQLVTAPPAEQPTPGANCMAKATGARCIKASPDCESLRNSPHDYSDTGPEDCPQTPEPLTCCVPPQP